MRVVVIGATGNVGTSTIEVLRAEPAVTEIVGVARRLPEALTQGVTWRAADISRDDLRPVVAGADAVILLAWLLQPSRDERTMWATNVVGTRRVLDAVVHERVPAVLYASSIGAYSPAPPGVVVDETWPTDGVVTSAYSRHKAYNERVFDAFSSEHPDVRVVRMRPGLILKAAAASHVRRLFAGPLLPTTLLRLIGLPVWPRTRGLQLQFVDSHDVAEAFRLALLSDATGAFNVAAEPVVDAARAAEALEAFAVPTPAWLLRAAVAASWRLRLQPTDPGWVDMAVDLPIMSTRRAREELGWLPSRSADQALADFVAAVGRGDGYRTPPLDPATSGPGRVEELRSGIGRRP